MTTPVPALNAIHHVAITVTDIDASLEWYERVLGLKRLETAPHEGGYGVIVCTPDQRVWLVLHHHDANERERFVESRTGLDHIGFDVGSMAELEAWRDRFTEMAVTQSPITPIPEFGVAVLVFRDPDNIQLELFAALS